MTMNLKILTATAFIASLIAAPVLAQSGTTGQGMNSQDGAAPAIESGTTASTSMTEADKAMYGEGAYWTGFFTDDTMTTLKADADVKATFSAMGADDQAAIRTACDRVNQQRGTYGSVSTALCAQVGL